MNKQIKVVQLQYRVSSSGDFVRRLHNEFLAGGMDSKIVSLYSELPDSDRLKGLGKKEKMVSLADNRIQSYLVRNKTKESGMFSYPVLGTNIAKLEQVQEADVIYLHWVLHGFLNLSSIEQLAKLGKPVIFIMHDMWTITGGCHHSFECEKYKTGCHTCYMFSGSKKNDLSAKLFQKKLKLYSEYDNFYFASPSKWLYECALQSGLTKNKPVFHIPNVLDRELYKPFDKGVAKQILNINPEDTVIAFGAVAIDSPYKGWAYLKEAMDLLYRKEHGRNITVLIFGGADKAEITKSIPFNTKAVGHLKDEYTMAVVYNAADVFIAPSLADNLPYTIFESLACGTPAVAFKVGGIPDLIDHKRNGYLAEYKNADDITKGVLYCLDHEVKGYTLPEFDNKLTIQKHKDLFAHIQSPKTVAYSEYSV